MTSSTTIRRPRRYDPERRSKITEAALKVIVRDGLDGLTHRAVAELADVPVSSTTYHFSDKEDLLLAAVDLAETRSVETLRRIFLIGHPEQDLAGAVSNLLEYLTVTDREQLILDYEIFLAARRRPSLRSVAERWAADNSEMLRTFTDEVTAQVLAHLFEGCLVQAVVFARGYSAAETRPIFDRVLRGCLGHLTCDRSR